MQEENRNLFDLQLDETEAWETLQGNDQAVAIQILARLIARMARQSQGREKDHE